ncbi:MAG: LysR family transcriptional regulator [Betaproteobacteria bacterium]|nr:LysR family transcriptional regulator [Betaproteobacteria bacterium]MCC7217930.1 LysR family transcriptional regulator [Burkholderiales bacterium]
MPAALNFKHLRYFWAVARTGSLARAAAELHVTPQSISGQLAELEDALGVELTRRAGRGVELTDTGRRIAGYADDIFALGDALVAAARDEAARRSVPLRVGIADVVPKAIAYRVVEPALALAEPVRLVCREGSLAALLSQLALHRLDVVIADRPLPADVNVRGYNHLIGASDLTVFAAPALAMSLPGAFPACLDGAPFLLPGEGSAVRPQLTAWLEAAGVQPRFVGEFDDGALMKAFGQGGSGVFAAPTATAGDIVTQYGVRALGRIGAVVERFYAITTERRMRDPATRAVFEAAQRRVFGAPPLRPPADSRPPSR